MRRHLMTAVLAGLFALLFVAADANACCHKRKACAPAPCATACPAPAPVSEPCPPATGCCKRKHRLFGGGGLGLCHKKKACAPACPPVACAAPVAAPSAQAPSGQM